MTSSPTPDSGPSTMIPIYNKAVIFYHRHMFETALLTLKPLVQKLDNCDECSIALIGVLMLRLLLATNRLRKAYDFLEILLQKLGTSTLTLTAEDSNPQEVLPGIDDNLARCLKLLCMLSMVVNRKVVLVPEDGVCSLIIIKHKMCNLFIIFLDNGIFRFKGSSVLYNERFSNGCKTIKENQC